MAGANWTTWLLVAVLVACANAALPRHAWRDPNYAGVGAAERPAAKTLENARAGRGRRLLQLQPGVPSYHEGNGRVVAVRALSVSGSFEACLEDIDVSYTTASTKALTIHSLTIKSSQSVRVSDTSLSSYNASTGELVWKTSTKDFPCSSGVLYQDANYKPSVSALGLPKAGAWQCLANVQVGTPATPVQWSGTQPQCVSYDGQRCIKPTVCSTNLTEVKARKVVTPLACGPHHLSVYGVDGYVYNHWCDIAKNQLDPYPATLPYVGPWSCPADMPADMVNTPVRWVGFHPQCDSLDGKKCNKPTVSCAARLKELQGAITPLTCGPYHASVWNGGDGYDKPDTWCSRSRKILAPQEIELLPVRVAWQLAVPNAPGPFKAERTLWLTRAKYGNSLQAFITPLPTVPTALPTGTLVPFQVRVVSGTVLGYSAPRPSYYSGKGRIQALGARFDTAADWFDVSNCFDDLSFTHSTDAAGAVTISALSSVSKNSVTYVDGCVYVDPETGEGSADYFNHTVACRSAILGSGDFRPPPLKDTYRPTVLVFSSTIELLPVRVGWDIQSCDIPESDLQTRVLWLVRQKGVAYLQGFMVDQDLVTDDLSPPKVIPAASLRRVKVLSGNVFGFKL